MTSYITCKMLPYALLLMWLPQTCHYIFLLLKVGVKREQDQETWSCIMTPRMVASVEIFCSSEPTKSKFFCVSVTKNDTVLTDCGCVPASPSCFVRKYLCCICKSIFFPDSSKPSSDSCVREKNLLILFSSLLRWKPWGALPYLVLETCSMPKRQVQCKMSMGQKAMERRTRPWATLFVSGFSVGSSFVSSHCAIPWIFLGFFGCREPYLLPNEDILVLYILEIGDLSRKQSVMSISRGI